MILGELHCPRCSASTVASTNTTIPINESPESSVWPGMTEARQIMKDSMPRKEQLGYEFGFFKAFNWLQSRTAVKAEGLRPQIADNLGQPDIDWNNDHEFRKSNQQSQPTAGEYYAKDQMLVAFAMGYERKSKELDWSYFKPTAGGVKEEGGLYISQEIADYINVIIDIKDKEIKSLKSQPSPSNPSFKRPTIGEIKVEIKGHTKNYKTGFNNAINWLLSIQPDK